jgi:hypothetical protein
MDHCSSDAFLSHAKPHWRQASNRCPRLFFTQYPWWGRPPFILAVFANRRFLLIAEN